MNKIIYATTNQLKLDMARYVLEPMGFEVIGKKINDLEELQLNSIEEVAIDSSRRAYQILNCPVLKNDSGLVIPSLNGFPGPYSKYVEETITEEGILKLMEGKEDRKAYFLDALAYTENGKTTVFISKSWGTIAKQKEGTYGYGYDNIFIPDGQNHTLATMPTSSRLPFFSNEAYLKLGEYLKQKEN